jgi:hypothetical protein
MQFERTPFERQRGRGEASIFTTDNFQKARDFDFSGVALTGVTAQTRSARAGCTKKFKQPVRQILRVIQAKQ